MFKWLTNLLRTAPKNQERYQPRYIGDEVAYEEPGEEITVDAMLAVRAAIARLDADGERSIA